MSRAVSADAALAADPLANFSLSAIGGALRGRATCAALAARRYRGLAVLQLCARDRAASPATRTPGTTAVLAQAQAEEEAPMRSYVAVHVLDRFFGYLNPVKRDGLRAWEAARRKAQAPRRGGAGAALEHLVGLADDDVAEWPTAFENDSAAAFAEAAATWLPAFMRSRFDSEFVAGPRGGVCVRYLAAATAAVSAVDAAAPAVSATTSARRFWTWRDLTRHRASLIADINRPDALRYDEICPLSAILTVAIVRALIPEALPDAGAALDRIQVLPRGLSHSNLFVEHDPITGTGVVRDPVAAAWGAGVPSVAAAAAAEEEPDATPIDFDLTFHTSSSEFMILFPAIADLTAAHYRRLLARTHIRAAQTERNREPSDSLIAAESEHGQLMQDEHEGELPGERADRCDGAGDDAAGSADGSGMGNATAAEQRPSSLSTEAHIPLAERVPFGTFYSRLLVTMTHEAAHVVQGVANVADTTKYKMAVEHDASVTEEPLAYLIAKRLCDDPLAGFLFPPGLAELHAPARYEKCHNALHKIDPSYLPEYEEFLRSYGTHRVARVDAAESGGDYMNPDAAWAVANAFAYNMMPHYATSASEVAALLRLTFAPPRWNCNLHQVPMRERVAEAVASGAIRDPVAAFRAMLQPAPDAAARILKALVAS
jgi:hypothetical protein